MKERAGWTVPVHNSDSEARTRDISQSAAPNHILKVSGRRLPGDNSCALVARCKKEYTSYSNLNDGQKQMATFAA